jgi:hypothetical protein
MIRFEIVQKAVDLLTMINDQTDNGNYDMVLVNELYDMELTIDEHLTIEGVINTLGQECIINVPLFLGVN